MLILLVRGEEYEGMKLYRALFPLGHSVLLATSAKQAQLTCQQSSYQRALVWMSMFRVPNGAAQLVNFLDSLPDSQAVSLVVSPDMQQAVESITRSLDRPLPRVREVWVLSPADEQKEIPARLQELAAAAQAAGQASVPVALPGPAPASPPPPEPDGSPARLPVIAAPVAPAAPAQVERVRAAQGGPGGWLGVWSVRGGCGATTLAVELARLSAGRALVGLDNPSLALALGLSAGEPWTQQLAQHFSGPVVLGPSRYEVPDSAVILDMINRVGLGRLAAIADLPSGSDSLTRAVLQSGLLVRLVLVLTPDRTSVAQAVHALSTWRPPVPVCLVWNMADWAAVNAARSGLSMLRSVECTEVGVIGYHANVREARNRCQSLADAAADGVNLGGLVVQARGIAAALLPELSAPSNGAPPSHGTLPAGAPRVRRRLVEVVDE